MQANPQETAILLSRRCDSNPRPVVYETVVGRTGEYQGVHLFAHSCQAVPLHPGEPRLSAVRIAIKAGTEFDGSAPGAPELWGACRMLVWHQRRNATVSTPTTIVAIEDTQLALRH